MNCKICHSKKEKLEDFFDAFKKENLFGLENRKNYKRSIFKCKKCGHFTNEHKYQKYLKKIYKTKYSNHSYGNVQKKFNLVKSIKKNKSSNYYRCKFIISKKLKTKGKKLLDVGAGIGIFAYTMKKMGWNTDVIEFNKDLIKFLKKKLNIPVVAKNIIDEKLNNKKTYDLITLNKVLEHFTYQDSIKVLNKLKNNLNKDGYIYIEVPDGEKALKEGGLERQEFFLEHFNIYSKRSLKKYCLKLNFKIILINAIKEITGKYTIRTILQKNG